MEDSGKATRNLYLQTTKSLTLLRAIAWLTVLLSAVVVCANIPVFYQFVVDTSQLPGVSPELVAWVRSIIRRFGELLFFGLAIGILWRSRDPKAILMGIFAASLGPIVGGSYIEAVGHVSDAMLYLTFLVAVLPGVLGVLLLFVLPDGEFSPKWGRYLPFLIAVVEPIRIYLGNFNTGFSLGYGLLVPLLLVCAIGIWAQIQRYQREDYIYKQQFKWLIIGATSVVTGITLVILGYIVLPKPFQIISAGLDEVGGIILAFSMIFAVTRYRLYDIDLFINRSLAYVAVFVILALLSIVAFAILHPILQSLFPTFNQTLLLLALVIPIIFLFEPIRRKIQHWIDRRIYHFRFDLDQVPFDTTLPSSKQRESLEGQTIANFKLEELIGHGGISDIYRAIQDGQLYALKILNRVQRMDEIARKRFQREARLTSQLTHPNIIHLHSYGEEGGRYYMVLEFVEGLSLSEYLKTETYLSFEEALPILENIVSALSYAHKKGFVHRDIKPGNVMLRKTEDRYEAVLMDFGLAKMVEGVSTVTGLDAIGTVAYMSPEQIREGRAVDQRTDIYGLGVMLYELLTGVLPFQGGIGSMLFGHVNQPAPNPQDIVPDIPDAVAAAIQHAMQKDPDKRFQSVEAFLEATKMETELSMAG